MSRLAIGLCLLFGVCGTWATAQAQTPVPDDPAPAPSAEAPSDGPTSKGDTANKSDKGTDEALPDLGGEAPTSTVAHKAGWEDVVVLPRKAFLKNGRVEFAPIFGVSVNDVLIRHYAIGASVSYFITDVLGIGVEGQWFNRERSQRESLVGLQYNRIGSINQYLWGAALNFSYVPGYGKFSLFNRHIFHWEVLTNLGVGAIKSEILARNPSDATFTSTNIAPNFGLGGRLFVNRWLTVNLALRDYVFNDKFEPTDRKAGDTIDVVKQRAATQFVHNVMIYAGVGFYLPSAFQYKTGR